MLLIAGLRMWDHRVLLGNDTGTELAFYIFLSSFPFFRREEGLPAAITQQKTEGFCFQKQLSNAYLTYTCIY